MTHPMNSHPMSTDLVELLRRLRTSAFMLLQNSEGCAANHYGDDHQGVTPQWLTDCRRDLEEGFDTIEALQSRIAALEGALTGAERAINAAFGQAEAEYQGHDARAGKYDAVIRAWREKRDAALSRAAPENTR